MPTHPLYVETWGHGQPVLFIHGLGASARYWDTLRAATSGFRGVAPDLLGFGRSPAPDDSSYDVAAHLESLTDHLPRGAVIVAHSTGAILAAALARERPADVRGMVLLGLPAYPDMATARVEVDRLGMLARLTAAGHPLARTLCTAMCRLRPLAIVLAPLVHRDVPAAVASDAMRHTWASYQRTLRHVVLDHLAAQDIMASLTPVVLLHGRNDRTASASHIERLAAMAAAQNVPVTLQLVDGDHHLAIRRPEAVATALAAVLSGGEGVSS